MCNKPAASEADYGENQQIVFTEWMGHSPQDVEDQITYPLTVSLLGIPGVKTVRSFSFFGFSSIYVIFKDDIDGLVVDSRDEYNELMQHVRNFSPELRERITLYEGDVPVFDKYGIEP